MRVLLDECLPRGLKKYIPGHSVTTVPEAGWAGKKNGDLLRAASGSFDVFITVDRNLVHQQGIKNLPFGVVVLRTTSNRLGDLLPLASAILAAVLEVKAGENLFVGG